MLEKFHHEYRDKEYFTTGEAADICSVTPNAVLKWVQAGKIPASRTPGGHHRIPREVIVKMLEGKLDALEQEAAGERQFQYCWEYNARDGRIQDGCLKCIAYRSRSGRCYEMAKLPVEAGHSRLFCQNSCEECEYYELIKGLKPNILIITNQPEIEPTLMKQASDFNFNIRFSDCEYKSSMIIEKFRPDYVVVDCSFGMERSRELTVHLSEDPRIPFARLLLVGETDNFPSGCDQIVFAYINRPLKIGVLSDLIAGLQDKRGSVNQIGTS